MLCVYIHTTINILCIKFRATDVNPSACNCTKKTLSQNGVTKFDVTAADLVCESTLVIYVIVALVKVGY